jgi:hypothetical protein
MPPKATYKAMERDPSIEFEHFLAQKLGMTVQDMVERMSAAEFVSWEIYYGREAQRVQMANRGGGK